MKNLKTYFDIFKHVWKIVVQLENSVNKYLTFNKIIGSDLIDFCWNYCKEFSNFDEIKNDIKKIIILKVYEQKYQYILYRIMDLFIQK